MPAIQEKQLFQLAPTGTVIASAYSPGDNTTAIIRTIYVAEVAGNEDTMVHGRSGFGSGASSCG